LNEEAPGNESDRDTSSDSALVTWLDGNQLGEVATATYWNDEEVEKEKAFDVVGGEARTLVHYLRDETTSLKELEEGVQFASDAGYPLHGVGVDAAAGVCWTTAIVSRIDAVKKVYAIDISKHRLLRLAPIVLRMFQAQTRKITRVLGTFDHMRLDDASIDFCLLSQALHHAEDPLRLLRELRRVLKPGGTLIVIGEDPIYPAGIPLKWLKNVIKLILPEMIRPGTRPVHRLLPTFAELFPTNETTGDHYYRIADYHRMFRATEFELHVKRRLRFTVFLAVRRDSWDHVPTS
jgi:ubiquinone/menaquinone biosynthesis C-methylase UbiE